MKVRVVKGFKPNRHSDWIREGAVFEVRKLPENRFDDDMVPYQIIEGPRSGQEIPFLNCVELPEEPTYSQAEYNAVNQELLQRREEVKELMVEKGILLQQIERTLEEQPKPVVLPREVAEAIKLCHDADLTSFAIIALQDHAEKLFRDYPRAVIDALHTIKIFSYTNSHEDSVLPSGAELIISALANGYTVEETADDKVIKLYKSICEKKCNPLEAEAMRQMAILQNNTELLRRMDIVDGDMPF